MLDKSTQTPDTKHVRDIVSVALLHASNTKFIIWVYYTITLSSMLISKSSSYNK